MALRLLGVVAVLLGAAGAADAVSFASSYGSHMVLQRSPASATVWGFAPAGTVEVTSTELGLHLQVPVVDGVWSTELPPQAGGKAVSLTVAAGSSSATITDVLFGDVILCSGQSNMVFSMAQIYNASEEVKKADDPKYQDIRLFTVTPTGRPDPQPDLPSVEQNWTRPSSAAVGNTKPFSYFSAVCWLSGINLFDRLDRQVPLGLVVSAYGGTRVHSWSGPSALAKCNQTAGWATSASPSNSILWNAMIVPLLQMRLKAILWLQGESDVNPSDTTMEPQRGGVYYACAIKAMVQDWRVGFKADLPFIFVQLSPWVGHEAATSFLQLPAIRAAQMSVLALPSTGYSSAVDLGDFDPSTNPWGGVHFRNKVPLGPRLSSALLALAYGQEEPYLGPTATTANPTTGGSVVVAFDAQGRAAAPLSFEPRLCPFFALNQTNNVARCAWFEVCDAHANCTNATATLTGPGDAVVIDTSGVEGAHSVRYLWGDWPVATLYNKHGLPAVPFWLTINGPDA